MFPAAFGCVIMAAMSDSALHIHRLRLRARRAVQNLSDRAYLALHKTPPKRTRPDFVLIGAMKTGTTSLHNHLGDHPDIYMTYVKEPGFFLDHPPYMDANPYVRTRERLERIAFRGYSGEPLVGESSTYYTEAPTLGAEAPRNMHAEVPDIKLVYMLRNPLDRVVSHYWHCIDLGIYDEGIDSVLAKDTTFLERSLYHYQLSRYLDYFPADRIHLVLFEEFKQDTTAVLNGICRFLGVDPLPADAALPSKQYNRSVSRAQGANATAQLSPASYEALIGPLKEDLAQLEQFLGRSLDLWDLSPERWCTAERTAV